MSISNIGGIGGGVVVPLIPPTGQLAIGAFGRVRVVPTYTPASLVDAKRIAESSSEVEIGKDLRVVPRLMMDVSFSADHRVVEGVELARLVEKFKRIVEAPGRLVDRSI